MFIRVPAKARLRHPCLRLSAFIRGCFWLLVINKGRYLSRIAVSLITVVSAIRKGRYLSRIPLSHIAAVSASKAASARRRLCVRQWEINSWRVDIKKTGLGGSCTFSSGGSFGRRKKSLSPSNGTSVRPVPANFRLQSSDPARMEGVCQYVSRIARLVAKSFVFGLSLPAQPGSASAFSKSGGLP